MKTNYRQFVENQMVYFFEKSLSSDLIIRRHDYKHLKNLEKEQNSVKTKNAILNELRQKEISKEIGRMNNSGQIGNTQTDSEFKTIKYSMEKGYMIDDITLDELDVLITEHKSKFPNKKMKDLFNNNDSELKAKVDTSRKLIKQALENSKYTWFNSLVQKEMSKGLILSYASIVKGVTESFNEAAKEYVKEHVNKLANKNLKSHFMFNFSNDLTDSGSD
jgi:hypothetical protein